MGLFGTNLPPRFLIPKTTAQRKCRWTQVTENATVACNVEQIDALHARAKPVALRVLSRKRFMTRVKSFDIRNRIYTSPGNETRCGTG
jgi:hypothetical protein